MSVRDLVCHVEPRSVHNPYHIYMPPQVSVFLAKTCKLVPSQKISNWDAIYNCINTAYALIARQYCTCDSSTMCFKHGVFGKLKMSTRIFVPNTFSNESWWVVYALHVGSRPEHLANECCKAGLWMSVTMSWLIWSMTFLSSTLNL